MSARDEFLKNAAECARMAENTRDSVDKAAWRRLAESWQRLGDEADEPFAPRKRGPSAAE
jgi:hypothetical protein